MPFGPYEDHEDCVDDNQEKEDPDAYCVWLKERLSDG